MSFGSVKTRTRIKLVATSEAATIGGPLFGLLASSSLLVLTMMLLASGHVIGQPAEEEVELLRPQTAPTLTSSQPTSSKISNSSSSSTSVMKRLSAHQQPRQAHIYRIRAAQLNGNLEPPIRVLPNETFGVRGQPTAATNRTAQTSAKLQHPDQSEAVSCAKSSQDEQESLASGSSSSISATSQVLRFVGSHSGNNSATRTLVQRLGEIEESPIGHQSAASNGRQTGSILVGDQLADQHPTATTTTTSAQTSSLLNLIDEYDSKIITNKTRGQLSCDSGEMILRLNFSEPFKGIVYPDNNRLSPCRFFGDGHHNYELRLPLRGCGTKQLAQRVFVNDVIVRFHKTLELEEDEVKTLICRYPPPLTATSSQRPSQGEQENQFELIEQTPRLPSSRPATGQARDNLLAAPPGGHQSNYGGTVQELVIPSMGQDRGSASLFQQTYGAGRFSPNGRPNADLIDQRSSSATFDSSTPTRPPGGLIGYFERLSSIELLFLISSMMFLVLLALGLAGGYLCLRRRQRAAGERQASAILRRKRRFMGSSGMLGPSQSPSAGLLYGPPPMRAHHHRHAHHPYANQERYLQQRHHRLSAASSPESDLSGRGHLLAAGSRAPNEHHHRYMFSNQAFVSDLSGGGQKLAGSRAAGDHRPVPPPKPVIGRRGESAAIYGRSHQVGPVPVAGRQAASQGHNYQPRPARHLSHGGLNEMGSSKYGRSLHRAQQVYVEDLSEEEPRETLARAKSLTCVPEQPTNLLDSAGGRRRWQPIVGGTLSRYPIQRADQWAGRKQEDGPKKYADAWLQVSSDSEVEPNNNDRQRPPDIGSRAGQKTKPKVEPEGKLILKSIEDSYITKFTEIERKEYTKRDSLRPLGLVEWRQKIAEQQQQQQQQHRRERKSSSSLASSGQPNQSGEASSYKSSSSSPGSSCNEEPELANTEAQYRSANTNLRSLTELDVNFAKSLLQSTLAAPVRKPEEDQQADQDLVVSPEYDLSNRLELADEPAGASSNSRNSVSYV